MITTIPRSSGMISQLILFKVSFQKTDIFRNYSTFGLFNMADSEPQPNNYIE